MLEENVIQNGFKKKEAQSYLEKLTVNKQHEVPYEHQEKEPFSSTSDVDAVAPEPEKGQLSSKRDVDIMPTQTDVVTPAKGGVKRQVKMGPLETYISSGNHLPLLLITNNRDQLLKEVRCRSVLVLFFRFLIPFDCVCWKTLNSLLKVRNVDLGNIYVAQDGTDAKVTKVCVGGGEDCLH
jgi:hypothetical protein